MRERASERERERMRESKRERKREKNIIIAHTSRTQKLCTYEDINTVRAVL